MRPASTSGYRIVSGSGVVNGAGHGSRLRHLQRRHAGRTAPLLCSRRLPPGAGGAAPTCAAGTVSYVTLMNGSSPSTTETGSRCRNLQPGQYDLLCLDGGRQPGPLHRHPHHPHRCAQRLKADQPQPACLHAPGRGRCRRWLHSDHGAQLRHRAGHSHRRQAAQYHVALNPLCRGKACRAPAFLLVPHRRCRPTVHETDRQSITKAGCSINDAVLSRHGWDTSNFSQPQPHSCFFLRGAPPPQSPSSPHGRIRA